MLNVIVGAILKESRKMEQEQFEEIMNTTFVKLMKDIKPFFKEYEQQAR